LNDSFWDLLSSAGLIVGGPMHSVTLARFGRGRQRFTANDGALLTSIAAAGPDDLVFTRSLGGLAGFESLGHLSVLRGLVESDASPGFSQYVTNGSGVVVEVYGHPAQGHEDKKAA
jgi:hypothetical protein